jgi:outer membrane protein assembly factor BamA
MRRSLSLFLTAVALLSASFPADAQKFLPKDILFNGAPDYSTQELLAVADLKPGTELNAADMKAHAQKLMDTGVFETLSYKFDGGNLVFTLVPSTALYPVRLENLPLTPGKELDSALHNLVPLYRGKVPSENGLLEQVRQGLEEMLAARGIKATVAAMPFTDQMLHQVTAMSFAITSPAVQVGEIHPDGTAAALDSNAMEILAKLTGSAYDRVGSPNQIETVLGNYYRDKGYLEAEIRATPKNAPEIAPEAVRIPFQVSVAPGTLYKLTGIQLAPGLLVTQAEFDRQSNIHPGDIADGKHVRENWHFVERQYHNQGFLKAAVHVTPSFNRAQGTASFTITVEPGPVYTMGTVTIENVGDNLRAMMLAAWKVPAGTLLSEGAVLKYFAIGDANPALARVFATVNCKYVLHLNDDTHTADVVLRLEKKP